MADRLMQVAEVLARHQRVRPGPEWLCSCGTTSAMDFAQHQADMLRAAGLLPETTSEWAHIADGYLVEDMSREDAEREGAMEDRFLTGLGTWPARVVRREVTEWHPADEGSES